MAKDYASPAAMSGEAGLETILNDPSVHAVAIVLPALVQVSTHSHPCPCFVTATNFV